MPHIAPHAKHRTHARTHLGLLTNGLLALAAASALSLAAGCNKPAPACVKLKSCCDTLQADAAAYGATEAAKTCATFATIYPKNPSTGEVPGDPFCESLASDLPTSFVKATRPPPSACDFAPAK